MNDTLTITITKTADGLQEYVQIMSADMFSINVVLIADAIVVEDSRAAIGGDAVDWRPDTG